MFQQKSFIKSALPTIALCFFLPVLTTKAIAIPEPTTPKEVYNQALDALNNKFYYRSKFDLKKWGYKSRDIDTYEEAHFYIQKLTKSLNEPYTRFLTKEEFKEEQNIINSKMVGIGIKMGIKKPIILDVLLNSPAQIGGIKSNDYILAVNGRGTLGLSNNQILNLLRGPNNSPVRIKLLRDNQIITKTLKRKELNLLPVSTKYLDSQNKIALIKIDSFIPENTSKVFKTELNKVMSANGIILDLRNNSGGLLKNATEIADMFLTTGKITSTQSANGEVSQIADQEKLFDKNVIILVNENTASASEILASALQDNKRAIVIGTKIYGKGLVQEIVKLSDDSALHVTIAKYLTPSGKDIDLKGLIPNEIIYEDTKQLNRAIEILTNTIESKLASI